MKHLPVDLLRGERKRGAVRLFTRDDVARVGELFMQTFRAASPAPPQLLLDDLERVFLDHPRYEERLGSLVYERSDGEVAGFLGCLPAHFHMDGALLEGTLAGTWMVDQVRPDAEAGTRLILTQVKRPQDFTFSDTSNSISVEVTSRLGFSFSPVQSLEWVYPISYAAYAASVASRKLTGRESRGAVALAARSDGLVRRMFKRSIPDMPAKWTQEEASPLDFARELVAFSSQFRFRPDWSAEQVAWQIETAGRRPSLGPLRLQLVRDGRGKIVGGFAHHVRSNGHSFVVQAMGDTHNMGGVLAALVRDAASQGCFLSRGSAQPFMMGGFFRLPGVLFRQTCGTLFRSADPLVTAAAHGPDGFFGGLAGEKWSPITSESYA